MAGAANAAVEFDSVTLRPTVGWCRLTLSNPR